MKIRGSPASGLNGKIISGGSSDEGFNTMGQETGGRSQNAGDKETGDGIWYLVFCREARRKAGETPAPQFRAGGRDATV